MTTPGLESLREQLARVLDWEEAHVGFAKAIAGIPDDKRGALAAGFEHTPWQLLEHLRIATHDLLDFAINPHYAHAMDWPRDYWPKSAAPTAQEWDESVAAFQSDLARLQTLARDASVDLLAPVPTGKKTQTYLRTILLTLDHNAYHVGQLVAVRRALGIWRSE
jgi:uncharacterized damage-inducible protein DinB